MIILFSLLPGTIHSQCKKHYILNQSITTEGITNSIDNYYQNLIIQDIALASQQTFHEISVRFDFKIHYTMDQCRQGQIEIRALPVTITCFPLFYNGYDISAFIKPEKADLVFHIIESDGLVVDSLFFFDIPLEKDSSLYTSLTSATDDKATVLSVSFSRAVFHFTKSSYEIFRDRILQIDQYYAASLIADSARVWAEKGFLSETGNKAEMIMRQVELERIIKFIRPGQFSSVFISGMNDLDGLTSKYQELLRLNNRLKAIIHYNRFESDALGEIIVEKELLNHYLDRFDHYYQLAFKTDFRFVNFIDGLATPYYSNAGLIGFHDVLNSHPAITRRTLRLWCSLLVQGLIERGGGSELAGNQLRALTYYKSAYHLSQLMNLHDNPSTAYQLIGRTKNSISASYIEISRKSAVMENPGMAAQYFHDAQGLFAEEGFRCFEPVWLDDYENWLFLSFESQVVKYIDLKNYGKALIYLNEIQTHCLSADSYSCPEQFHDWMITIRTGIYHDLLNKTQYLLKKDELSEAEQVYRQAIAIRLMAGYRIDKDVIETEFEISFRQIDYDELFEEGHRYFNKEEFSLALYFFNKADFLERFSLIQPQPELFIYRQAAARQVILQILSDGRVKAWANDFESAGSLLDQVESMLSKYRIADSDSLTGQYLTLKENINRNECERILREYNDLMSKSDSARVKNDFVLAHKIAGDAVALSMRHLNCRIRDEEAWYKKVLLELPAEYQIMEDELDDLTGGPYSDYLTSFQNLKNYYYRHKLLEQGVVFIPLFDRLVQMQDSVFLTEVLDHYIMAGDFDHAFRLLERLHELGLSPRPLAAKQRSVAESFARRDANNPAVSEPWKTLEIYTGHDSWYRSFSWKYKATWLDVKNWKLKYWPFIWKNLFFTL